MEIRVTIEAVLSLPDGAIVPENGRGFTLPNGDWVKPFMVLEMNDARDLSFADANARGCDVDEITIEWEEM